RDACRALSAAAGSSRARYDRAPRGGQRTAAGLACRRPAGSRESPDPAYMPTAPDVFAKIRGHERVALLPAARDHGLLPYFHEVESPAMPVVQMDGAPRIMLGSNNSLGLTADERVMAGARDALATYGTGLTGSRLLNGTTPLHLELERELADWMGT